MRHDLSSDPLESARVQTICDSDSQTPLPTRAFDEMEMGISDLPTNFYDYYHDDYLGSGSPVFVGENELP